MKLPALLVSDTHLTDNPRDEYRWGLFPWLQEQIKQEQPATIVHLGDLTDAKDHHSSTLTNRICDAFADLSKAGVELIIQHGNHDYLRRGHTYFEFLRHLPGVQFITKPTEIFLGQTSDLFLPHTKTPGDDWADLDLSHFNYVFMHQTVNGARASNGQIMEGEQLPDLSRAGKIYSGDIHVPQVIGPVEYVGSPYHVHFGDRFEPRCVLLDRRHRAIDLQFETISRLALKIGSLKELRAQELSAGDQVKLTITLSQAEAFDWQRIRREAAAILADRKVEVCDLKLSISRQDQRSQARQGAGEGGGRLSDPDAILRFVEREDLGPDALDAGLEIIR